MLAGPLDFAKRVGALPGSVRRSHHLGVVGVGRRLQGARQQHDNAKALDAALFGEDFETA